MISLFGGTITGVTVDGDHTVDRDGNGNGNPINALGTLILDFADGAQLTVPPAPIPDDSWLIEHRYGDDDEEPYSRDRPRLRRLGRGGGFKPRSRGQRGWALPD